MSVAHTGSGSAVADRAFARSVSIGSLRVAVEAAHSDAQLVKLSQAIWQGHAVGALDDDSAQALSEFIHARRMALRGPQTAPGRVPGHPPGRPSIFRPKRPQRSPNRIRSMERRRTLAASGPLPPALAARFTCGELATLKIVADEVRQHGTCSLCTDAIAARAGVSNSTARNALRTARRLGILSTEERRRQGQRNDTNIIRVTDATWTAWIAKGKTAKPLGVKNLHPTVKEIQENELRRGQESPRRGCRKAERHRVTRSTPDPERYPKRVS